MIDLIERIGPVLGIVAFVGLAVLAFLIFQQAREVRRLREWAGRAPERAEDAVEASLAAAEARGEAAEREPGAVRARLQTGRERFAAALGPRWEALDRRFPFDPRYVLVLLAAVIVAAGVLTSGFGIFSDDGTESSGKRGGGSGQQAQKQEKPEAAVLNATQVTDETGAVLEPAVSGLAGKVADQVLKPAGYEVGREDDAASGVDVTVIMFEPEHEAEASELAEAVEPELGPTEVEAMIQEVRDLAGGADLVLLIGQDDAQF